MPTEPRKQRWGEKTVGDKGEYSMIISTCPDKGSAQRIAEMLVEAKLAACVQVFPIESMYVWQGKVCNENECMLFIKTEAALFDRISAAVKGAHPYEVPEIIQIPVTDGLPEYLSWISDCVAEANNNNKRGVKP